MNVSTDIRDTTRRVRTVDLNLNDMVIVAKWDGTESFQRVIGIRFETPEDIEVTTTDGENTTTWTASGFQDAIKV